MNVTRYLKLFNNLTPNSFKYIASLRLASHTANSAESSKEATTHFGFQTVKEEEKQQRGLFFFLNRNKIKLFKCWVIIFLVHKVFEDVAKSYDLMNDAMSMGIHRLWKDMFIERLGPTPGTRLLDMAGGTGDISFRYLKYLQNQANPQSKQSHVTVSDINQHMLDVGEERAKRLGLTQEKLPNVSIEWKCANAEELPFADNTYNAYTIAFGIRNCTHIDKVCNTNIS